MESLTPLALPAAHTRNPFAGKGLAVTLALLLCPDEPQSLADLAGSAETSRPLAAMVVKELRRHRLVAGDISQGRTAELWPTPQLLIRTAEEWPNPVAGVIGGTIDSLRHPVGGRPAIRPLVPPTWDPPPRLYVRHRDEAEELLAFAGGHVSPQSAVADWEIAIVDYPFEPGIVPAIVAALELMASSRGREMVDRYAGDLTDGWRTR